MNRPSGIPSRLDSSQYDAFDDTDFAEVLEGMSYQDGGLCSECSRIDFRAIFEFFRPKIPLSKGLNNALRESMTCVFCCAIATAAAKRPALIEAARGRALECDIRSWQQHNYKERGDQTYPYLELVVYVKSSKNPGDVPWLPERLRDPRIQPSINEDLEFITDDPLLVLEVIGKGTDNANITSLEIQDESSKSAETVESRSNTSESSGTDSDDIDFEEAYIQRPSAAWRSRQVRVPLGSKIDFDLLNSRLNSFRATELPSVLPQAEKTTAGVESSLSRLISASQLRLINVLTGHVEIIQTPQRYVALSYVCGSSPPGKDILLRSVSGLTSNIVWSINWSLVPRSIRDARQFVCQLGELYLWVDCLCIDQADNEDKRAIIAEMMSIYGCAYVTLAAVAGNDGHFGLPGVYEDSRIPDPRLSFTSFGNEVCLVPKRPLCFSLVHRNNWNTRAWTCQEYLLSPRLIFVTEVETFIVVGNNLLSERFIHQPIPASTTTPESTTNLSEQSITKITAHEALIKPGPRLWSHYGDCLVRYSQRYLTHLEDRFAAFQGILNRFREEPYLNNVEMTLSGLPYQWFYASLLWEDSFHTTQPKRITFDIVQSRPPPSWSWIGWDGAVRLHESRLTSRMQTVKVQILDKVNIKCESLTLGSLNSWPFEPSPYPANSNECSTLHLWATRIALYLRPYRGPLYRIEQRDEDSMKRDYIGNIWLDPQTASVFCNEKAQDFIIFDHHIMLVQRKNQFYERRGMGKLMWLEDGTGRSQRIRHHVDQLGALEHLMLR